MLLLETFETIGGVWLALSAIAFILGAAFVNTRQKLGVNALESMTRRELLAGGRQASPAASPARESQLDRLDTAKKRPVSKPAADLVKAA